MFAPKSVVSQNLIQLNTLFMDQVIAINLNTCLFSDCSSIMLKTNIYYLILMIQYDFVYRFAQENDLIFLETSARTGESVEEAFLKCSKTILAKIETGELDPERIGSGNYRLLLLKQLS